MRIWTSCLTSLPLLLLPPASASDWRPYLPALPVSEATKLVSSAEGKLFALTYQGYFVGGPGGQSWKQLPLPLGPSGLTSLLPFGRFLMVSRMGGPVYRSIDGGAKWDSLCEACLGNPIHDLSAVGPDVFLTYDYKTFHTRDSGTTWTMDSLHSLGEIYRVFMGPAGPTALHDSGVCEYHAQDSTWHILDRSKGIPRFYNLSWTGTAWVALTFQNGVYRGTPDFAWTRTLDSARFGRAAPEILVRPGSVFVASDSGVFQSRDDGLTWTRLEGLTGGPNSGIHSLAMIGDTLIASQASGQLWKLGLEHPVPVRPKAPPAARPHAGTSFAGHGRVGYARDASDRTRDARGQTSAGLEARDIR